MVTSSPVPTSTAVTGTPLPAQSTAPAWTTPAAAGATSLTGNGWALSGAVMAVFYALA
jgi:hypothetical protein